MRQKPCFSGRAFNLVSANFNSVPLVVEYHRPESVAEAVELLQQPDHVALAGGTVVNADRNRSQLVAVDLQSLGLKVVSREASRVQFGAMCRLSDVERQCGGDLLAEAARRELPSTLRTVGTVGGTVAAGGGESLMLAALMASGASVRTANGDEVSVERYVSAPSELIIGVDVTAEGVDDRTHRSYADGHTNRCRRWTTIRRRHHTRSHRGRCATGGSPVNRRHQPTYSHRRLPWVERISTSPRRHVGRARLRRPVMKSISLTLNGRQITSTCEVHETLRTFLRSQGMFSVHYGSDSGETGAGAVLLDGELVSSDVVLAVQADGHSITTVEALNTEAELHPIQAAFVAAGAFQSGYSAGAMVLGTLALLEKNPAPTEEQIRDMLSGILDRETAYVKPVEAIHRAAAVLRGEETEAFAPLIVPPLTQQGEPAEYDPSDPAPTASAAVPRHSIPRRT